MKVLAVEEPDPDLPVVIEHARPAGCHVSDIIKVMLIEHDSKKYGSDSPIDLDTIERGYVWEQVLSDALRKRRGGEDGFRPEPFQHEGVWMSPDWVNPESDFALEEWKATRVSKKSDVTERHWYWFIQILCYLKGLGGRRARLRVWYINGDYSDGARKDPKVLANYVRYSLEFTEREIDEGWRRLISFARKHSLLQEPPSWADAAEEARCRSTKQPLQQQPNLPPLTTNPRRKGCSPERPRSSGERVLMFPRLKSWSRPPSAS